MTLPATQQQGYARRYYLANKDKHRKQTRRYYEEHRNEISARERKRYAANREKIIRQVRNAKLEREFGISLVDYDQILIAQGGRCTICGDPPTKYRALAVDHDHETGNLRGLLCSSCNIGLGHFKDDPARLAAAMRYLEEAQ